MANNTPDLILSYKFQKFLSLLDIDGLGIEGEYLEGQTAAGKTTVGIGVKLIMLAALSPRKLHLLCGLNKGKLEENIISKDLGILDIAKKKGYNVEYFPDGHGKFGKPHILVYGNTPDEDKIIRVAGYDDKSKWRDVLGGQYGIVAVDEANIADMQFLRELAMRKRYWMFTLNPDNPDLEIYKEFINHSRPLKEFKKDYPQELYNQLLSRPYIKGYIHWYFTMDDNAALTEEEKERKRNSVPVNSKEYKNKILGLRCKSEGLVISEMSDEKIIPQSKFEDGSMWLPNERIYQVVCGLDSGLNADATALTISLMTTAGRLITIPTFYYVPQLGSNSNSQQATYIEAWLDYWLSMFRCCNPSIVSITGDSAALTQDLIYEINLRTKYSAAKVGAKDIMKDTQRVKSIVGTPNYWYIVNFGNRNPLKPQEKLGEDDMLIVEFNNIVWDKKKGNVPEDGNDHCFDSFKYQTYFMYYGMMGGIL